MIGGAILAGGRAKRYQGVAKGMLPVTSGRSIIDGELEALHLAGVVERVIVSDNRAPYAHLGLKILPDLRPGIGPLGGIETALSHYAAHLDAVLFLPCDLPGIGSEQLKALIAAYGGSERSIVVAETVQGALQPLCAVVSVAVLPSVSDAIERGIRQVSLFWREQQALAQTFEEGFPFFNVNSPEDWKHWKDEEREWTLSARRVIHGRRR